MIKNKKSKYIKSCLLVVSTLPFLLFYSIFLYFIPALYVSFVVPYLIWRIWGGKNNQRIKIYFLLWKAPIIFFIAFTMIYMEIFLLFIIFATGISLIGKIIIFGSLLFLLRCLTYAMMIFIWQPSILKSHKVWGYVGVILYCIANSYFIYSTQNAPDTDDYSILFSEYLK